MHNTPNPFTNGVALTLNICEGIPWQAANVMAAAMTSNVRPELFPTRTAAILGAIPPVRGAR